jgi:aldehyde dehydrogenase (NAD+)
MSPADETSDLLQRLGVHSGGSLDSRSPIDGSVFGSVPEAEDFAGACERARVAFLHWRDVPAPRRGELVRLLGEELRAAKEPLARLVTLECGKILQEGLGEVQEMIDICDFAVGLSRQLYGLTIASERPSHRMIEQWHPLGPVAVISAFNFPVAVWAWNAALALVCGDPVIWKPSEKAPLCAEAVMELARRALERFANAPEGLLQCVHGGRDVGQALVDDARIALVSATGSTAMGRQVGPTVAKRFGRALLELGGNNAAIVTPSADIDLTERAILFAAAGTAGQRCTTLRRLIVHESVADELVTRLKSLFSRIKVGDPRDADTLVGPLIDEAAFNSMREAIGDSIDVVDAVFGGFYVRPAIVEVDSQDGQVLKETFAPILYVLRYSDIDEAIALNYSVSKGLSS